MLRPISLLKLPEFVRRKFQAVGCEYVEDIEGLLANPGSISVHLKAIIDEYKVADKVSFCNTPVKIVSADELRKREFCNPPVAVFHEGLDRLLDGGLPVGRITELCGPPGCGKTQMCLQFCADVQIPSSLGGSAGEVLYISTDFGFGVERLSEIIQASIQHCHTAEFKTKIEREEILKTFTLETLLKGVNVLQVYELKDLIQALRNLNSFLQTNPKLKLIIIDSFSLPFITEVTNLFVRRKIIAEMFNILLDKAIEYKLAVVLTNQLTTIFRRKKPVLKPSLGEGYAHRLHQRLLLDNGKIYLTKSIKHSQMYIRYEITKDGIR